MLPVRTALAIVVHAVQDATEEAAVEEALQDSSNHKADLRARLQLVLEDSRASTITITTVTATRTGVIGYEF